RNGVGRREHGEMEPQTGRGSGAGSDAVAELGWLDPRQRLRLHDRASRLHEAARSSAQALVLDHQFRSDLLTPLQQNSCNGLAGYLFCPARPIAYLPLPSIRVAYALGLWLPSAGGWDVTTTVPATG